MQEIKSAVQHGDAHEEFTPIALRPEKAILDKPAKGSAEAVRIGYTGFLYIRCAHCGKERGFCAKLPITESKCRDCGEKTALENLHKVRFICKCGKDFSYLTNISDDMFEISCLNCGTPNPIFRNPKTGDYSDEKRR